jgi:hypothetical protein
MFKLLGVLLGFCTRERYTFPMRVKPGQRRSEAARRARRKILCTIECLTVPCHFAFQSSAPEVEGP